MSPFIIFALPRSRTAWLARFLTYGGWACHHEMAISMRSIDDVKTFLHQTRVGVVETAAAQGWWVLKHHVPDLRMIVIRRPVEDVVRAMMNVDLEGAFRYDEAILRRNMLYGDRMLEQIASRPDVLTLDYADLNRDGCATVFEHCLGLPFDEGWWESLRDQNVQVNVAEVLRYYHQNRDAVEAFKKACKSELRRLAYDGMIRKAA